MTIKSAERCRVHIKHTHTSYSHETKSTKKEEAHVKSLTKL